MTLPYRLPTAWIAVLLSLSPLAAQPPADPIALRIAEFAESATVPGVQAAILLDGELAWTAAVGWADLEGERPMTTGTILNVGSTSKLVTATVVLQLVERGAIELDAAIGRYLSLPVNHPSGRAITVRQLLTHTAGVADSDAYGASYACGDPTVSLREWIRGYFTPGGAFFSPQSFLDAAPGTKFEYANVGFGLLGLVAEEAAGIDFARLTREKIFEPLGMSATGWTLDAVDRGRLATPYWLATSEDALEPEDRALLASPRRAPGSLVPFCLYGFPNYPDGLVRTNVVDLARFAAATIPDHARSPLLSAATRAETFRDHLPDVETDGRVQGLGWRRNDYPGIGKVWGHGGADPGIQSQLLHRPEDGVTVVVMTNRLVGREILPLLQLLFEEGGRLAARVSAPVEAAAPGE